MRTALGVSYNGTAYQGWQSQPSGRTVQDQLEKALCAFTALPRVGTLCAGRTDAGVHGLMQVVHFDTDIERPDNSWVRGTNRYLPPDIAVCERRYVVNVKLPQTKLDPNGYCPAFERPQIEPFTPKPHEQHVAEERIRMPGPTTRTAANGTLIPAGGISSATLSELGAGPQSGAATGAGAGAAGTDGPRFRFSQ